MEKPWEFQFLLTFEVLPTLMGPLWYNFLLPNSNNRISFLQKKKKNFLDQFYEAKLQQSGNIIIKKTLSTASPTVCNDMPCFKHILEAIIYTCVCVARKALNWCFNNHDAIVNTFWVYILYNNKEGSAYLKSGCFLLYEGIESLLFHGC